jgi:hypothetical protein
MMSRAKPSPTQKIPTALEQFRRKWEQVAERPGLDRVAKAAAMSNNSVLDLTAPPNSRRNKALIGRLKKTNKGESNLRTWARLAMQLALVLEALVPNTDKAGVKSWVDANHWGLSPEEFGNLLEEAKAKINRAEEQISGAVSAERIRIGIFPLIFLGDDPRPKRGQHIEETTNASFLGAFARLALRSVKPEYQFEYDLIGSLRDLSPQRSEGALRELKIGVFGIVARERDTFAHIPLPGWRYRFACIGPSVEATRRAVDTRGVFSGNTSEFLYLAVKDSSPASYLLAMFGETLPQKRLDCKYSPDKIAAAYAAELSEAKLGNAGDAPVPLLFIDEAMADEVARHLMELYPATLGGTPPKFVDLLGNFPEGPTVPVCFQVHRDDKDLIRLLHRAIFDEQSHQPGEIFTLGALPTARAYARALVWILSRYTYDLERGPGAPASDSLLSRVQTYFHHLSRKLDADVGVAAPKVPAFCRFWRFDQRTQPPIEFVNLLSDELVSRLIPVERYDAVVNNSTDNGESLMRLLELFFPLDWLRIVKDNWARSRFGCARNCRLPGPQDDWKHGPASEDHLAR